MILARLSEDMERRNDLPGWELHRAELCRAVADAAREEGQAVPGRLGAVSLEENRADPAKTRYVYACRRHGVLNCPRCLPHEKPKK